MRAKIDALHSPGHRPLVADASPRHTSLRLELLGGLAIEGPSGPLTGRAAQRRRLALLAILAAGQARGRGVSRERLVAYLWPDADVERGRPLLSDSVYRINQSVGSEVISAFGDELRLNDSVVSCDVPEFERAVESGERERAASLYAGALLDGVHLVDGAEFERWLDGERARLARIYAEAICSLAESAESRGAMTDAVSWWGQLAAHDPYSSRIALRLMQALERIGDSAAAIRHATAHSMLLREELGVAPNAAVLELAEHLTAASMAVAPAASVAVLPFADLSPQRDNAYFTDGIAEELISALAHLEGVRVAARTSAAAYRDGRTDVREVGRRLGVAMVLEGSVRKAGSKMRITIQLVSVADGFQVWSASYDRELTDVFAVQEDISRAVVSALRVHLVPVARAGFARADQPLVALTAR